MTTQYAVFSGLPTGLTLTKKVFTLADPDVEVTGITGSVTERTNALGQYVVDITKAAVITGIHTIILFVGSTPIAIGSRTFAGTDGETATTTPETVELDSATQTQITAIETFATRITTGIVQDGAVWQFTANMLELGPSGGSGLTGPFTRTITVTDSDTSDPIEGATVRLYRTGETGTEAADVDGVASFTVEAATWSYAITASGYTGVSGTIVVSANGNTDVELTISSSDAPDDPALCLVTIPVYDQFGQPLVDEPVDILFVKFAANATATPPVLSPPPSQTSDENGQVIVELWRLAKYRIEYGEAEYRRRVDIDVPNSGTFVVE